MIFLYFIGGVIFGVIATGFYFECRGLGKIIEKEVDEQSREERRKSSVQFVDPVTPQQKFDNAKTIDDMLGDV